MRKFNAETAAAALELEQMLIDYWQEIDGNAGRNASAFFTADCTGGVAAVSFKGHAGVQKYYADRLESMKAQNNGVRTSRHVYNSLKFAFEDKDRAVISFVLISYAGFGPLPIMDNTAPVSISDARFECKRNADDQWRIFGFHVTPLFVNGAQFAKRGPAAR